MPVLVMRLAGPLQSWGASARFARRTTQAAPTKSGVIGMLAAALGRDRDADLSDLAALRFGVRVDQPGTLLRDYQTARHFESGESMPVSERFYLADAVFVAAVQGETDLLSRLLDALRNPVYLPYLGRRSCPPSHPVDLGIRDGALQDVLICEPWRATDPHKEKYRGPDVRLEILLEAEPGEQATDSLRDQPLSFDPRHRRYAPRAIRSLHHTLPLTPGVPDARGGPPGGGRRSRPSGGPPVHDPTAALTGPDPARPAPSAGPPSHDPTSAFTE